MDHSFIEEHHIVSQYLLGQLTTQERETFEAHFLDCERCLDVLELNRKFIEGLRSLDAEEILRGRPAEVWSLAAWLARYPPMRQFGLFAAAILLLAIPVVLLLVENAHLRTRLNHAQTANEPNPSATEDQLGDRNLGAADTNSGATAGGSTNAKSPDIAGPSSNAPRTNAAKPGSRRLSPQVNTPILILASLRELNENQTVTRNELVVPNRPGLFLISIGLESSTRYERYSVTIKGKGGSILWRRDDLKPDRYDTLAITCPNDYFSPGNYDLILKGINAEGKPVTIETYAFQIIRKATR
jgi:hypothetical protein